MPFRRAVDVIAAITAAIGVLLYLTGYESPAIMVAGFIPARFGGLIDFPPEVWAVPAFATPLTAAFLHAGLLHLMLNLVILVYIGREVERALGPGRLTLLYVIGALAAALAQWGFDPQSIVPMVGASGAISALVGAYSLLFGDTRRVRAIGPIPARAIHVLWLAAAWIVLQVMMDFVASRAGIGLATAAHVGGFLIGLALARPLLRWRYRRA